MTLSPTIIALVAVAAAVCFWLGWAGRAIGRNRREAELKREALEGKRAIPQLESSVRSRDQQLARLQHEVDKLTDQTAELSRDLTRKETELRSQTRELRSLTSELAAVKGTGEQEPHGLLTDGFEYDLTTTGSGDTELQSRLSRTEALYDKLKDVLLQRDERIEELEDQLTRAGSAGRTAGDVAADTNGADGAEPDYATEEADALRAEIAEHLQTIDELKSQVRDALNEKQLLEDLAKRRSDSNRALKSTTAEVEARVPELERQIEARDATIAAREVSIKRLQNDLELINKDRDVGSAELASLSRQLENQSERLAQQDANAAALRTSLETREQRITTLEQELAGNQSTVVSLQEALAARETEVSALNARIAETAQSAERASTDLSQATGSLKSAIADRDFRLDTLTAELAGLQRQLTDNQTQLSYAEATAQAREAELTAESEQARQQNLALQREIEDLGETVKLHERWLAKLKTSLADREAQMNALDVRAREAEAALTTAEQQLSQLPARDPQAPRTGPEAQDHAGADQVAALVEDAQQAQARADAQTETISALHKELTERDVRLDAVAAELRELNARLAAEQNALTKAMAEREEYASQLFELESAGKVAGDDHESRKGSYIG